MKFTLENIEFVRLYCGCSYIPNKAIMKSLTYMKFSLNVMLGGIIHLSFEGNSELSNQLRETSPSWDDIQVITSDGSVVLELGQLGSKIVCTQQTYGDPSAYYLPSSVSIYYDFIKGKNKGDFSKINNSSKTRSCLYSNIFNLSLLKRPDSIMVILFSII